MQRHKIVCNLMSNTDSDRLFKTAQLIAK